MGTGDPNGMAMAHALASSMGGIKTAGDLVARMQLKKMRLNEAKAYVAGRLGVSTLDLSDSTVMRNLREELDIGVITGVSGLAKGLEAKARIADLLGIKINCVERFKAKSGMMSASALSVAARLTPQRCPKHGVGARVGRVTSLRARVGHPRGSACAAAFGCCVSRSPRRDIWASSRRGARWGER